jgi:hypothetical protein
MIRSFNKCDGKEFKWLGEYDTNEVCTTLLKLEPELWTRYYFRRSLSNQYVNTIPIYWQTCDWKKDEPFIIYRFLDFCLFFPLLDKLHKIVMDNGIDGVIVRAMFTSLQPQKSIPEHIDGTDSLELTHRCHWVIQSDLSVIFTVNDVSIHLPNRQIYEVNNLLKHSVDNPSESNRIHFIFDIIPYQYITKTISYIDLSHDDYRKIEDEFVKKQVGRYIK